MEDLREEVCHIDLEVQAPFTHDNDNEVLVIATILDGPLKGVQISEYRCVEEFTLETQKLLKYENPDVDERG